MVKQYGHMSAHLTSVLLNHRNSDPHYHVMQGLAVLISTGKNNLNMVNI